MPVGTELASAGRTSMLIPPLRIVLYVSIAVPLNPLHILLNLLKSGSQLIQYAGNFRIPTQGRLYSGL